MKAVWKGKKAQIGMSQPAKLYAQQGRGLFVRYGERRFCREVPEESLYAVDLPCAALEYLAMLFAEPRAGELMWEVPERHSVDMPVALHANRASLERMVRTEAAGQKAELIFQGADTWPAQSRDRVSGNRRRPEWQVIRKNRSR